MNIEEHLKIIERAKNLKHPLKNPDSRHYEMIAGIEAIEVLEAMFPVEELMVWAKISYMKYQLRLGKKDDVQKELAKMNTFKQYYEYLGGVNTSLSEEQKQELQTLCRMKVVADDGTYVYTTASGEVVEFTIEDGELK